MEDKDEEDIFLPANMAELIKRRSPAILKSCRNKLVTTPWVQKKFKIGYTQAAKWLMEMENQGLITYFRNPPLSLWDRIKNKFLPPRKRKHESPYILYKVLM